MCTAWLYGALADWGQISLQGHQQEILPFMSTRKTCAKCGTTGTSGFKLCPRCLTVNYCGQSCQRDHANTHRGKSIDHGHSAQHEHNE
jgi:hypothetical protein